MNLWPFVITFLIITAAELGDKTQLLTLGFSTKYPVWEVVFAVSSATAVLMALAVVFGGAVNYLIPAFYLQLLVGITFIFFGLWTLREGKEEKSVEEGGKNPFWLIFSCFFLAELGDKTQLATLSLSAKYGTPIQVWLGATLGMAGVNIMAALAGSFIKKWVSERTIRWLGAAIFMIFGIFTLWSLFFN